MIKLHVSLAALGLLSSATIASATDINSAAVMGSNAFSSAVAIYPQTREDERKWLLQRLEEVCSSKLRSDQQRCDRAWRIIADGYVQLQARRSAEMAITNPLKN